MPHRLRAVRVWASVLALALALALFTAPAWAQDGADPVADELVEELGARYEVLELSAGFVIRPLDDEADFRLIEILDGEVRVDGEKVSRSELRRFVDADADVIYELAEPVTGAEEGRTEEGRTEESRAEEIRRRIEEQIAEKEERFLEEQRRREEATRSELDDLRRRIDELRREEPESSELRRLTRRLERLVEGPPAPPAPPRVSRDSEVSLGSGLRVERDERVRDAVVIGGDLVVEGEIDGDATVVFGSATIDGYVDGTVVSVLGRIDVLPGGHIDGDAVAIGGGVHRQEGARVDGEVIHMDFGELIRSENVHIGVPPIPWLPLWNGFDGELFSLIGRIFRIAFFALLALLVYVIAAKKEESVSAWVGDAPWRSVLVGLVVQVLSAPVIFIACILLIISVVGIPLALLLPFLAAFVFFVFLLMGYTAVALCLGDWAAARFGWARENRYLVILLGMALIETWSIVGDVFGLVPFFGWIGWVLVVIAFAYKYAIWTLGLGAVFLEIFSSQPPPSTVPVERWDPPAPKDGERADGSYSAYDEERHDAERHDPERHDEPTHDAAESESPRNEER